MAVGTLRRGSVEEAGSRYRVSVRLIDGASGADFKRTSFEQAGGELLVIRDTLTQKATEFLRERLGEEVQLRERRAGTRSVPAWSPLRPPEQARQRGAP